MRDAGVAYVESGFERGQRTGIDGGETVNPSELRDRVIAALKTVYDPEMPVNIYELGLIYEVRTDEAGQVAIKMTLTAPNCPVAGTLPGEVERKAASVPGVAGVKLELVFDPPWTKDKMSEAAKLALGIEDVIPITRIMRR
jgi:FeS assembly SUF system protein